MRASILLFAVPACFLVACDMQPIEQDLAGTYKNQFGTLSETIILNKNGTFSQEVKQADGLLKNISGNWERTNRAIEFKPYLLCIETDTGHPFFPPREFDLGRCSVQGRTLVFSAEWSHVLRFEREVAAKQ